MSLMDFSSYVFFCPGGWTGKGYQSIYFRSRTKIGGLSRTSCPSRLSEDRLLQAGGGPRFAVFQAGAKKNNYISGEKTPPIPHNPLPASAPHGRIRSGNGGFPGPRPRPGPAPQGN